MAAAQWVYTLLLAPASSLPMLVAFTAVIVVGAGVIGYRAGEPDQREP